MSVQQPQIDQNTRNALSRQIAVYGQQTQGKLMALRVFIYGITGLGIEVAKNLILAGPKQVTIYDPNLVTIEDVGRNFYCREDQVGKISRAEACLSQLKDLNPNVQVSIAAGSSIQLISSNFDCAVIIDNYNKDYLVNLNKACHSRNVGFILAGNLGLYGYTFVDFGQKHKILDPTGEEVKSVHFVGITQEEKGTVLFDDKKHGLNDGDTVVFREVKGMTEINGESFKIEIKSPHSFIIGDTRNFSPYTGGGIATQVKVPIEIKSYDLQKSLRYPYPPESKQMPIANWEKFGVPEQLHVVLNCLYYFYSKHHRIPRALNQADAAQLQKIVKQYQNAKMQIEGEDFKVESVDQKLVQNIALYADAQISPCSSFWGGIITQQIVKLTGKYTPLRQWLHHQFFEVLPEDPVTRTIPNNRYHDYHVIFGDQFVKKASQSSSFVVGAGALGCQFIKMFALMGLSTQAGKISVTDDDNIQISNLNRQFLFRKHHVGKNKSQTACQVGKIINPDVHFQSLKLRVSQENEIVFNDDFWTNLSFVVNAVDNVKARQYIDGQCVWFQKPLFESGTLGTKCHSQIIIPHATVSYTDIIDPPEQSIPLCTLKNFPYQIEHTIQWARDYFEGIFSQSSSDLVNFFDNREAFLEELSKQHRQNPPILRSKLESIKKLYDAQSLKSYEICVELAVAIFQDVFNHQIRHLLRAFPADSISNQTKKPFWSGLKRVPTPLELNLSDPIHAEFIQAGANIYATMFGLPVQKDQKNVIQLAAKVKPAEFVPKGNIVIETDQNKNAEAEKPAMVSEQDEQAIEVLLKELRSCTLAQTKPTVIAFEKDDPTNYHIQFMAGVSNLRARNYKIEQVDKFKVKLIAGKIIPAIATTTAMIVGAVGIEVIKYLLNKKISSFKNVSINLALPLWVFNDPLEAIVNKDKTNDIIMGGPVKVVPGQFTKWEKINIKGPMTVQALKKHLEDTYKIQVSMITSGSSIVYSNYDQSAKKKLPMKVPQAVESSTKKQIPHFRKFLALGISGNDSKGIDCILPDIRYQI